MSVDITQIVAAVIGLCSAVVTFAWNRVHRKDEALKWVKIAVAAIEQVLPKAYGKEKKEAVVSYLMEKGCSLKEDELDMAIEAAVLELHNQIYGKK